MESTHLGSSELQRQHGQNRVVRAHPWWSLVTTFDRPLYFLELGCGKLETSINYEVAINTDKAFGLTPSNGAPRAPGSIPLDRKSTRCPSHTSHVQIKGLRRWCLGSVLQQPDGVYWDYPNIQRTCTRDFRRADLRNAPAERDELESEVELEAESLRLVKQSS